VLSEKPRLGNFLLESYFMRKNSFKLLFLLAFLLSLTTTASGTLNGSGRVSGPSKIFSALNRQLDEIVDAPFPADTVGAGRGGNGARPDRCEPGRPCVQKARSLRGPGQARWRTDVLAYQVGEKAFFVYGFAKNVRANIDADELKALKMLAQVLLGYSDSDLEKAVTAEALIEVINDD
jgi:hypothetical protein